MPDVLLDPTRGDDAGVRSGEPLVVADRPGQRHDEQEQRNRCKPAEPSGEGPKGRNERQGVPVEVGAERHEVREVHDHECRKDEIRAAASQDRDDETERADDQNRPESVPQVSHERDRRRMVVLEAEPALAREPLHAKRLVPCLVSVHKHERTGREERQPHQRERDRQPAPAAPRRNHERNGKEDAGILEAGREARRDSGELDAVRDHQEQRARNTKRERNIGHGLTRIGDVDRTHRRNRRCDRAGRLAVCTTCEQPRRDDRRETDHERDDAGRQERRVGLPGLERRVDVHEKRRVVEPVRISPASVHDLPRARNDGLLVRVQEVSERQAVLDADRAEHRTGPDERGERCGGPAPACLRPALDRAPKPGAVRVRRVRRRRVLRR